MRPLAELLCESESALPLIHEMAAKVSGRCVVHPPSSAAAEELFKTQVTTQSPMGAVVYHTGGITVEGGWLRILGSGSLAVPRSLPGWNEGRSSGFYPPLWTKECALPSSRRGDVPVHEAFGFQMDAARQLSSPPQTKGSSEPRSLLARTMLKLYKKIRGR